jgi:uncharacterized protein YndB with AHSA1/START domain
VSREILLTYEYPYPPEVVWATLTSSEELAAWLMPNDFRAEIGATFTMTTKPRFGFDGVVRCKVLVLEPPTKMVWSWSGGALDSELTFELTPTAHGTQLRLRQTGFRELRHVLAYLAMREGWRRKILQRIGARVAARLARG